LLKIFIIILVVSLGIIPSFQYTSAIDGEQPPTQAEQDLFDTLAGRVSGHSAQQPTDVSEKLQIISGGGLAIPIDCSDIVGATVDEVDFIVLGGLIKFDHVLAGQFVENASPDAEGYDIWQCNVTVELRGEKRVKVIQCEDRLMLNQPSLSQLESSDAGMILSESVLYHELLHGQLLINAYTAVPPADDSFREKMCKSFQETDGQIDLTPIDADHQFIGDLEIEYIQEVGEAEGVAVSVEELMAASSDSCNFSIDVSTLTEKNPFTFQLVPLQNIASVQVSGSTGTLVEDEGNCLTGRMLLLIDPPSFVIVIDTTIGGSQTIGGEYFTLDQTALLVAGLQTNLAWMIPFALSAAGIGVFLLRKKF